jgi:hypothetical protein
MLQLHRLAGLQDLVDLRSNQRGPLDLGAEPLPPAERDLKREMFRLVGDQGLGVMVYSPLAIVWVLSHPVVTVAITGGDTIAHLDNCLGSVGWTPANTVRQKLDAVSTPLW